MTEAGVETLQAALESEDVVLVRRRVLRQLVESLAYEGLIRPRHEDPDGRLSFCLEGRGGDTPVTYRFQARRRFSFGRLQLLNPAILREVEGRTIEVASPSQFLHEIAPSLPADPQLLARFADELDRTLLHDTLSREHARGQGPTLHAASYDELEGLIIDGHRYHPSYKSRVGFDHVDNLAFGPEFGPRLRPIWLAAHHDTVQLSASHRIDAAAFLRTELGPAAHERFCAQLAESGRDPRSYQLLPAHPWQWREQLIPRLVGDFTTGRLVALGHPPDHYCPQQSIRTLANATAPHKASLKLALSITNTSTIRTLAPHTVLNAALISDWLEDVVAADPFLAEDLRPVLLGELLGVSYRPLSASAPSGILGCIWRESLPAKLEAGEAAVPFTALSHVDPHGDPFIAGWVDAYGVEGWTRRLLEVVIPPVIHLLCAHGIALESHAQNLALVHRDGLPTRLALKDFHDGIRFAPSHLAAPRKRPSLHPTPAAHLQVNRNSYLVAETAEEVRDFVHDAFFFIALSEQALFLADHFALPERRFWNLAREVVVAYQRRFPHLRDRFALFDVLAPTIRVEQLTARRLLPDTELRLHDVPNPLAQVDTQ